MAIILGFGLVGGLIEFVMHLMSFKIVEYIEVFSPFSKSELVIVGSGNGMCSASLLQYSRTKNARYSEMNDRSTSHRVVVSFTHNRGKCSGFR
jgi:hypothetical protein